LELLLKLLVLPTGSVTAGTTGAVGTLNYSENASNTEVGTISNLPAGTYTVVTVTDNCSSNLIGDNRQPAAVLAIGTLLKLMLLALNFNWICNCWYCNWCGTLNYSWEKMLPNTSTTRLLSLTFLFLYGNSY
jgi:hypothetical protein